MVGRQRSCAGKRRHNTRASAEEAFWSLVRKRGAHIGQYHVYGCGHCGGWHVGHRPGHKGRR